VCECVVCCVSECVSFLFLDPFVCVCVYVCVCVCLCGVTYQSRPSCYKAHQHGLRVRFGHPLPRLLFAALPLCLVCVCVCVCACMCVCVCE